MHLQPLIIRENKAGNGVDHIERRTYRALGLIAARRGISKNNQYAVATKLAHMAFIAGGNVIAAVRKCSNGVVKLFRIEFSGQFRGIDDVAKQRGDLPAFAMQRGRKRIAGRRLLRDLGTALAAKECAVSYTHLTLPTILRV